MANSFSALSSAFAWGSLLLAVIALVAGLAWGWVITQRAENEARTEAEKCANAYIAKWLTDEAPGLVRAHVENLQNATLGRGNDDEAADAIGEEAG
ncbi:hypothetical protein [Sphingomonas albertensis]|uniref:Uncharacterized protein n=1 Tax=Sphingomonas albertensis TaxID=2762591 RepID=A0ABR7ANI1_9SPHN|nr:hypothetical protein [Sphingomonas albertensis]